MKNINTDIVDNLVDSLNETSTVDVGQFPQMVKPLLYKVYTDSLVSQFADIKQLTTPVGRVFTLFSNYGGSDTDDLNSDNSSIVTVLDASGLAVDDTLTTLTGTGTLIYKEGNVLLVKVTTGYFTDGQAMNGTTITTVISNRGYIGKAFKNYSGPYSTTAGETAIIRNLDYEVKAVDIEVVTRKVRSKISKEVIQDMTAIYGEDITNDILENEFGAEMIQSIDMEVIDYLKTIASPTSDLILSNSYGTQSDIISIANDLYANIYKITTGLMTGTRRRKNFFVMADTATMGLLMASPLHIKPEGSVNRYFMGRIGGSYTLLLDPFSTENYIIVGYRNEDSNEIGDSGLIFAPYINTIWSTTEPETGKSIYFNMVRYGYSQHPQDIPGAGNSMFFKMFNVNLNNLVNYSTVI